MLTNDFKVEVKLDPRDKSDKSACANYTWGIYIDGLLAEGGFRRAGAAQRHAEIIRKGF